MLYNFFHSKLERLSIPSILIQTYIWELGLELTHGVGLPQVLD